MKNTRETHPSYALVSFNRISVSGNQPLFGSAVRHNHMIRLEVREGARVRSHCHDNYMAGKTLLQVDMSQNQFAELITSMNRGEGTPATLRFHNGPITEEPPETHLRQQYTEEFRARTEAITADLETLLHDAETVLGKKAINKGDRDHLQGLLDRIDRQVRANLPFVQEQFNESMDKATTAAKAEVEAFYHHRMHAAGLAALNGEGLAQIPTLDPESGGSE